VKRSVTFVRPLYPAPVAGILTHSGQTTLFHQAAEGGLFAFAGLWQKWNDLEACTILTTDANELMWPLHDRMPVILDPSGDALWLDPHASAEVLRSLFVPCHSEKMETVPVSQWVDNPNHEGRECLTDRCIKMVKFLTLGLTGQKLQKTGEKQKIFPICR
jgi:SOS response associated peptidase (SRAP)